MSDAYTRSKVENTFAAYLVRSLELFRKKYLYKKERRVINESYLEELAGNVPSILFEEQVDSFCRENMQDAGWNAVWDSLEDDRLIRSIRRLSEEEREVIYLRVFEERPFKEISDCTGKPLGRVNDIYYYAIRKIKGWMGGR